MLFPDYCVCRIRGDPLADLYDGNSINLKGDALYQLTKHMDDNDEDCNFLIQVRAVHYFWIMMGSD